MVARDDAYPLFELLHAVRDNTIIDLREVLPPVLQGFPDRAPDELLPGGLSRARTREYHIGAEPKTGEPDLRLAALSRAAELAMVAYDVNSAESQVLQGWLMHDKFILKSTFGAPYEFLWANPYQPGLSYYHVPAGLSQSGFGPAVRALELGRFGDVVRLFRRRDADVSRTAR